MKAEIPDSSALRVALWRALHLEVDGAPAILADDIGLQLASPPAGWRERPDMHPEGTRGYRAAIVARARFIDDLVIEQAGRGIRQYVIIGAGLDSFAQRKLGGNSELAVFEIDKPATQEWKRRRLIELGYEISKNLSFVPVDFEAGDAWLEKLKQNGFNDRQPAVFASTGVSMYLSEQANLSSFREIARLPSGTTLALTFILPLDLVDAAERAQHEMVYEKARAAGTPFVSFFRPERIVSLAREAGFGKVEHFSRGDMIARYFRNRDDGLLPGSGEEFLVATCR